MGDARDPDAGFNADAKAGFETGLALAAASFVRMLSKERNDAAEMIEKHMKGDPVLKRAIQLRVAQLKARVADGRRVQLAEAQ